MSQSLAVLGASRQLSAADALRRYGDLAELAWPTFESLLRKGVPSGAIVFPELPKRARVVFEQRVSTFDFADESHEEAVEALIFLARDEFGEPTDLVAWAPERRTLCSHWGAVHTLGAETSLSPRLSDSDALPIYRDVVGWLRAGRFGLVLIDPQRAAPDIRDFGPFMAEDEPHSRELRELFRRIEPSILLSSTVRRRAA